MNERASEQESNWLTACVGICGAVVRNYKYCLHTCTHTQVFNQMYALTLWRCMLCVLIASKKCWSPPHLCCHIHLICFFRCKRHRTLFVCLQSVVSLALSLSRTRTQLRCVGYFIRRTTRRTYSINYCRVVVDSVVAVVVFVILFSLHLVLLLSVNWVYEQLKWTQRTITKTVCISSIYIHTHFARIRYRWYIYSHESREPSRVCVW